MNTPYDRLQTWAGRAARLQTSLATLAMDFEGLGAPPAGDVAPDDAMATLADVWKALGMGDPGRSEHPGEEARARAVEHLRRAEQVVPKAVEHLAGRLDVALARAAARGGKHPSIVRSADFLRLLQHRGDHEGQAPQRTYVLGPLSTLPANHPLRTVLPPDDFYMTSSEGPALVLGLGARPGVLNARPWYFLAGSLYLTRVWRADQRSEQERTRAREVNERAAKEEAFANSPAGREAALRRRVAELEAQVAGKPRCAP